MKFLFLGIALIHAVAGAATYQENVINIKADAEIKIIPNSASFDISILAFHKQVDSAISKIRPMIKATEKVFQKYQLDQNAAKITEMTVRPVYREEKEDDKKTLTGYEAIRRYTLTFTDMEKLSLLLVELKLAGVDDIGNIEFARTDIDSLNQVVLLKAIEKASRIAKGLSEKSNLPIGPAILISNEPPEDFSYENRVRIDLNFGKGGVDDLLGGLWGSDEGGARGGLDKIAALKDLFKFDIGEIKIENSVWVTFPIQKRRK